MTNSRLGEVWCETQDDITLIWKNGESESVEFVQVKGNEPDQLWSMAMLCKRESGFKGKDGLGTSILEKSLAYDRCKEDCCFRIVTSRAVNNELKILTYPIDSDHRKASTQSIDALVEKIKGYVGDFKSSNDRCCDFWVSAATWQEVHSAEVVRRNNLWVLLKVARTWDSFLFVDHVEGIYDRLLSIIQAMSAADHADNPGAKKIIRELLIVWVKGEIARVEHPTTPGTGAALKKKMRRAGIADEAVKNAVENRRQYREEVLRPQYQEINNRRRLERGVADTLHLLLAQFDAGQHGDSGITFHATCLEKLTELSKAIAVDAQPDMGILFGCMYNITDRCLHRFQRRGG